MDDTEHRQVTSTVRTIRQQPGNNICADCNECSCPQCSMKEPNWISEDLEIIVCSECKAIHERVTATTFKCLQITSDWTAGSIQKVSYISNNITNAVYERDLPMPFRKPTRCFDWRFREHWIRVKYIKRQFKERTNQPRYLWGIKKGYLWKRGRADSLFMRRWFVLDVESAPVLKYYSDANEEQMKGEIPLLNLDLCLTSEDKIDHANAMQIFCVEGRNTTRVIYLYSETTKDLVEWYQAVRIRKFIQLQKLLPQLPKLKILPRLGNDILYEDYLQKTGSRGTEAFRKRWFVLHGRKLHYFKDPMDSNPKGTISLADEGIAVILSGGHTDKDKDKGYHFKLRTPQRIFHFVSETSYQRELWIKAIHQSCYQAEVHAHPSSTLPPLLMDDHTEPVPPQIPDRPSADSGSTAASNVVTQSSHESDSESSIPEEIGSDYLYLNNGRILAHEEWNSERGLMVKGQIAMLKVPSRSIEFESGDVDLTVTLQHMDMFDITHSKEYGDMSVTILFKASMKVKAVNLPLEMELYHCGVLGNKEHIKPLLWIAEGSSWEQVKEDDDKVSLTVTDNTFFFKSKYFGSFAASMVGDGVLGKRMRCAAFCTYEENSDNLEITVYIFNNHVGDFMWKMIEDNESGNSATLLDISNEITVMKEKGDLVLSIETLNGLQLMPGNFTTLNIPFSDVWTKSYLKYHIELIQVEKMGHCQVIFRNENSEPLTVLNLTHSSESEYEGAIADPGIRDRRPTPHVRVPPIPSRHSSDKAVNLEVRKERLPLSERGKRNQEEAEVSPEASLFPFKVKQELAKVLDTAPDGRNWRSFAVEVGINFNECNTMASKVSPTMAVLKYCEEFETTLDEVTEALRSIHHDESFDIIATYLKEQK